jgi:hypothetical protein
MCSTNGAALTFPLATRVVQRSQQVTTLGGRAALGRPFLLNASAAHPAIDEGQRLLVGVADDEHGAVSSTVQRGGQRRARGPTVCGNHCSR